MSDRIECVKITAGMLTAHHIDALIGVGQQKPRKPNRLRKVEHYRASTDISSGFLMTRLQIGRRWFVIDSSVEVWVFPEPDQHLTYSLFGGAQ